MPATGDGMRQKTLWQRIRLWIGVVILAAVLYASGMPIIGTAVATRHPSTVPALIAVYSPLILYVQSDLPGSQQYAGYCDWCEEQTERALK